MGDDVLLVNDIHLSDRPPSSCTDGYLDDLFALLGETVIRADDTGAAAVVWAGDVFHHKTPGRTSHATVMRAIELAAAYPCPLYVVPGNHDLCVSADSEALTDQGWRRRDQLTGVERFATLNPATHAFEWQRPRRIFISQYSGEMIHFVGRRVDHLVTPNHDVFVRTTKRAVWAKRKAAMAPRGNYWVAATAANNWRGVERAQVVVPLSASGRSPEVEIPVELAADFFGWYLSEGSVEPSRVVISQCVEKHPQNYAEIVDLVKAMGFTPQLQPKTVRIGCTSLAEFMVAQFGTGCYELHIPSWVKDWPLELLARLLGAYRRGDGTDNGPSSWTSRTASDRLADDLQEIGVKLGIGVTISQRRTFPVGDSGYVGTARTVGFSSPEVTLYNPTRVPYSGEVWCPEVPNGVWMVRRNGRALWTGNSHDRLSSLDETQPLGVLLRSGHAHLLAGWDPLDINLPIYGVPWLQHWNDDTVSHALSAYRRQGDQPSLVVTHAPLYPPGHELKYEFYPAGDFAAAMGHAGSVHYGHVHEPHGIYSAEGVTFSNPGALSRGSLHEHNLTRDVQIAVWNAGTGQFTHRPLPAKPAADVFRLAEITEARTAQHVLDEFLDSVGQTRIEITSIESVTHHIRGLDLDDDLTAVLLTVLDKAHHG